MKTLDIEWRHLDKDGRTVIRGIAQEIVDDLEAALEQFRLIASDLGETATATDAD